MIALVDYGLGNIKAFFNIYHRLGIPCKLASHYSDFDGATHLILPGVGAFDYAIDKLNRSGMREKLDELVLEKKLPIMGICVGMQILANSSEEGQLKGLGWIDAEVKKFDTSLLKTKPHLPHMGWNTVSTTPGSTIFAGVENESFYFVHSYAATAPVGQYQAWSEYGEPFLAAVEDGALTATQFHPEKSGAAGLKLILNWSKSL